MIKVWEEKWLAKQDQQIDAWDLVEDDDYGDHNVLAHRGMFITNHDDGYDEARCKLAAAAPDMARVLLALEWSGMAWDSSGGSLRCPSCRSQDVIGKRHAPGCALDDALRKAGVR